jgi:hypothetical protein
MYDPGVLRGLLGDHPPRSTTHLMVKVFFDESGTDGHSEVMTMGGWAVRGDKLAKFERTWRRVLKRPGFNVSEAKARDIERRENEFHGWSDNKVLQFRLLLSKIIKNQAWFGIEMSVVVADYERVIREVLPARSVYRDPYIWVMQGCLELACTSRPLRKHERIACLFDRGHPHPGRTERCFFELLDDPAGPIGKSGRILRDYRAADSVNFGGLQAADMLAWGVRRGTTERAGGETPDYSTVHGLLNIPGDKIVGGYYDEEALRFALRRITHPQPSISVSFTPAGFAEPKEE